VARLARYNSDRLDIGPSLHISGPTFEQMTSFVSA
jgi:hypothetical protein